MGAMPARLAVLLLVTLAACSSAVYRTRADPEVITHKQMVEQNFQTAYDAVIALHGNWLNVRPNTLTSAQEDVRIYQDAVRLSGPSDLKNIHVTTIDRIQHFDPTAATTRWGVGHSQGAIQVFSNP